jgi:hypothetical protein
MVPTYSYFRSVQRFQPFIFPFGSTVPTYLLFPFGSTVPTYSFFRSVQRFQQFIFIPVRFNGSNNSYLYRSVQRFQQFIFLPHSSQIIINGSRFNIHISQHENITIYSTFTYYQTIKTRSK